MREFCKVLSLTALMGCQTTLEETVCLPDELATLRGNASFAIGIIAGVDTQAIAENSTADHNGIGHEGDLLAEFHADYSIRCGVVLDGSSQTGGQTDYKNQTFLVDVEGGNFIDAHDRFNQEDMEILLEALNEVSLDEKLSVNDFARKLVDQVVEKLMSVRGMNKDDAALYLHNEILDMISFSIQMQAIEVHEVAHFIHPLSRQEAIEHNENKSIQKRKDMCLSDKLYAADEIYKITLVQLYKVMQNYLRQKYPVTASYTAFSVPFHASECLD